LAPSGTPWAEVWSAACSSAFSIFARLTARTSATLPHAVTAADSWVAATESRSHALVKADAACPCQPAAFTTALTLLLSAPVTSLISGT
jgi:hypothetical protein